jgi:hypothetical protein
MPRFAPLAALAVSLLLALPAASHAFRLPEDLAPIPGNPANRLAPLAIDDEVYVGATHCSPKPRKGVQAAVRWLERHAEGVNWGTYRCEKWGRGSASLHAENRAIDWHPTSREAAAQLVELLLAPDRAGNEHALARRMGIEELIWDCSYWGAGAPDFDRYDYCYGRGGKRKKHVNPTAAHLDHVHIGFSKKGAAGRTSFWALALKR